MTKIMESEKSFTFNVEKDGKVYICEETCWHQNRLWYRGDKYDERVEGRVQLNKKGEVVHFALADTPEAKDAEQDKERAKTGVTTTIALSKANAALAGVDEKIVVTN